MSRIALCAFSVVSLLAVLAVAPASADPISAAPLAVSGTQAAGTAANVNYLSFPTITGAPFGAPTVPPTINANGQVTFYANLNGPGVVGTNNLGLWSGTPGNVTIGARTGDPAPSFGPGAVYGSFSAPLVPNSGPQPVAMNGSGQVLFDAFATGSSVSAANDEALSISTAGSNTIGVREGSQAPGNSSGVTFVSNSQGSVFRSPVINDAGHIGFQATVSIGQTGIWTGSPGSLQLVAQTGMAAPGTPAGVNFAQVFSGGSPQFAFGLTAMNASDQVAFSSALSGPGVNITNAGGLFVGSAGNVQLLARGGDQAPGMAAGYHLSRLGERLDTFLRSRFECCG